MKTPPVDREIFKLFFFYSRTNRLVVLVSRVHRNGLNPSQFIPLAAASHHDNYDNDGRQRQRSKDDGQNNDENVGRRARRRRSRRATLRPQNSGHAGILLGQIVWVAAQCGHYPVGRHISPSALHLNLNGSVALSRNQNLKRRDWQARQLSENALQQLLLVARQRTRKYQSDEN